MEIYPATTLDLIQTKAYCQIYSAELPETNFKRKPNTIEYGMGVSHYLTIKLSSVSLLTAGCGFPCDFVDFLVLNIVAC